MELPVYNNIAEFEENYLIDYSETKDLSLAKYLKNLKKKISFSYGSFKI